MVYFQAETGITAERLKEPDDVEATDQCNTCPLNKSLNPAKGNKCGSHSTATFEGPVGMALHLLALQWKPRTYPFVFQWPRL